MKRLGIIFDFDGVIYDSIPILYDVYLKFLMNFNMNGTQEEFDKLNGCKMSEIIQYLKVEYNIKQSNNKLRAMYEKLIDEQIYKGNLTEGIVEVLVNLNSKGYLVFLLSQASEKYVKSIVNNFNIEHLFTKIITSDDNGTKEEKYRSIATNNTEYVFCAIEDSDLGMSAALNAGHKVIFYNPKHKTTSIQCNFILDNYINFMSLVDIIKQSSLIVALSKKVICNTIELSYYLDDDLIAKVNRTWEDEIKSGRKLLDNEVYCYHSHYLDNDVLIINGFWSSYKYFFYKHISSDESIKIYPIAVSGIIIDSDGYTAIAKRNSTTQNEGCYELVPSGSIDKTAEKDGLINIKTQILSEYKEEMNGRREDIINNEFLGLTYDYKDEVYDICMKLQYSGSLVEKKMNVNDEYTNLNLLLFDELGNYTNQLISTSKEILHILHLNYTSHHSHYFTNKE